MTLYDIDDAITALVNEDGEIEDFEKFDELQIARVQKLENVALFIKNLNAEAKAIKAEEDVLKKRRMAAENKVQSLKGYLDYALGGNRFETARVVVSYSSSTQCVVDDGFIAWAAENNDSLLRYKQPEPDKTAIKTLLKAGSDIPYAELKTVRNIVVR